MIMAAGFSETSVRVYQIVLRHVLERNSLYGHFNDDINSQTKEPLHFVMSVRPHTAVRLSLDRFPLNFIMGTFRKIYHKNPNLVEIGQKCRALHIKT